MVKIDTLVSKMRAVGFMHAQANIEKTLSLASDNDLSHIELLANALDDEITQRNAARIEKNKKQSNINNPKIIEEFDFKAQTSITKREINDLINFQFIDNRENIVFIGNSSLGKTHLATGIALNALDKGYKVYFSNALELLESLYLAELKGRLKNKINQLLKFDLIVIDELGYLPMNKGSMYNLFQLIHAMYEYRSLIITSNKEFTDWNEFFCNDTVAVPVIERIIHHSKIFMLRGESYRLRGKTRN